MKIKEISKILAKNKIKHKILKEKQSIKFKHKDNNTYGKFRVDFKIKKEVLIAKVWWTKEGLSTPYYNSLKVSFKTEEQLNKYLKNYTNKFKLVDLFVSKN